MNEVISSSALIGAAELIEELGGDARTVARQAGVPPQALEQPETPVLGYALTDFYELAAQATQNRNFGLLMAQRSSLAVVGPVWSLLETAETIGAMVEDLAANFGIFSQAAILALTNIEGGALMSYEGRAGHSHSEVQMMEYALAIAINEMRRHCPPEYPVDDRAALPRTPASTTVLRVYRQ